MPLFERLWSRSLATEYQAQKEQNTVNVIARLSRGNVLAQSGNVMGGDELRRRSLEADGSISLLKKLKVRG